MKLGHVHIKVRDIKRAEEFYTKLLGFRVTERFEDQYVFLAFDKAHHDLALKNVGPDASMPPHDSIGLYHFALEVASENELKILYKKLKQNGVPLTPVDHGISKAFYFSDPDGNGIEVYVDTRHKRTAWGGKEGILDLDN
ncbi:VOC family protein [Candidatus Berkelbacteria bacterium]|nr:VOC family protein [Candidatus Berkelbacteria bacterium]